MKKRLLLTILTLVLLTTTHYVNAQDSTSAVIVRHSSRVTVADSGRFTILEGDASITSGNLQIDHAEKITFDKVSNKIIVLGPSIVTFQGRIEKLPRKEGEREQLEYKI